MDFIKKKIITPIKYLILILSIFFYDRVFCHSKTIKNNAYADNNQSYINNSQLINKKLLQKM